MIQFDNKKKAMTALIILAVIYSVIVFALPFTKNMVFVVSYLFSMLSILGQIYTWNWGWKGRESIQSKFYGYPVIAISMVYMAVQIAVSLLFMLLAGWTAIWIPVVIYVLFLGIALIGCIAADIARTEIERVGMEQVRDTQCIKKLRAKSEALYQNSIGSVIENTMGELCRELKYSDPVSSEELKPTEDEMVLLLNQISEKLKQKQYDTVIELANNFREKLRYRNQMCKVVKN